MAPSVGWPHLSKNRALRLPLECFFFFLPLTLLHFIVVQLHLEFLFFSVSVGQFCLVSATQAAIAERTDGSMLSESFSNLPSAGHRNGVVKPVIKFQLRLSGLLSRQSLLWLLHRRQRAISSGEMQPTNTLIKRKFWEDSFIFRISSHLEMSAWHCLLNYWVLAGWDAQWRLCIHHLNYFYQQFCLTCVWCRSSDLSLFLALYKDIVPAWAFN